MISLCYDPSAHRMAGPFGASAYTEALRDVGLASQQVHEPPETGLCLWWSPLDINSLRGRRDLRRLVVIPVAENGGNEAMRATLGVLGLVDPAEERRRTAGMLVGNGLFGDPKIAAVAGLTYRDPHGLQGPEFMSLPQRVARFLSAARASGRA